VSVSNCCISQGSVATYLRCGGNCYTRFVVNFFLFTAVQEFLKSVKIWQSYRQSSGPQFFLGHSVYILNSPNQNFNNILLLLLLMLPLLLGYFWCLFNRPIFWRLLQVRLGPQVSWRTFRDCWCKIFYRLDTIPVPTTNMSKHWQKQEK